MPYSLDLSDGLKKAGWKVKIREKERAEPPHVSVMKKQETWRWGLREQAFLDKKPPVRTVPKELVEHLQTHLETLIAEWDSKYPHNPVNSEGEK
ncbi:MAG: hypothetical protein HYW49_10630 [Deltaproteobacteria bacterium]|nr:hypothetical protein [Deltaproteobacteria bacterium]